MQSWCCNEMWKEKKNNNIAKPSNIICNKKKVGGHLLEANKSSTLGKMLAT